MEFNDLKNVNEFLKRKNYFDEDKENISECERILNPHKKAKDETLEQEEIPVNVEKQLVIVVKEEVKSDVILEIIPDENNKLMLSFHELFRDVNSSGNSSIGM